jgi:hypothetical protein
MAWRSDFMHPTNLWAHRAIGVLNRGVCALECNSGIFAVPGFVVMMLFTLLSKDAAFPHVSKLGKSKSQQFSGIR